MLCLAEGRLALPILIRQLCLNLWGNLQKQLLAACSTLLEQIEGSQQDFFKLVLTWLIAPPRRLLLRVSRGRGGGMMGGGGGACFLIPKIICVSPKNVSSILKFPQCFLKYSFVSMFPVLFTFVPMFPKSKFSCFLRPLGEPRCHTKEKFKVHD